MYARLWSRARVCVLPGCVWSGPRPEELKALNVIIRAVGEPSSNHTQITYTLTPTYNTSHPRAACMCVYGLKEEKEGLIAKERQKDKIKDMKYMCTQQLCILCCPKACVCSHACTNTREWGLWMCVCRGGKMRGAFFPLLFLPPSLLSTCQSYSLSHPSIFHFYMQLQMWRQRNIKLQKRACICKNNPARALPWPDTHILTLSLSPSHTGLLTEKQCGNTCSSLSYCVFR